jgi:3-oxoacyl-[acyl-carrier protein] reductase
MDLKLQRERALITGSSSGIGEAIARTLALERTMRGIAAQRGWGDDWPEIERRAVAEIVPNSVGRIGHVEDIANAVAFLASPLADYIDGATLRVDGGRIPSTF